MGDARRAFVSSDEGQFLRAIIEMSALGFDKGVCPLNFRRICPLDDPEKDVDAVPVVRYSVFIEPTPPRHPKT